MIGLVLVTHGNLAGELIKAMEHVVGPQEKVAAVCIESDDNLEERRTDILTALNKVDDEDGVVIITDMFGGTPSNLAVSVMDQARVEIIAGVNLPMLVKFASCRDKCGFDDCVAKAQEAGKKYISIASELLTRKKNSK